MYISIDMQRMMVLHKHPSMNVVLNLVHLEYPSTEVHVSDIDLALKHKSELEMKMLYKNIYQKDNIPPDFKEHVMHYVLNVMKTTDVDVGELQRLAQLVGPHDKKKYMYVKGQYSSFANQAVFDDTPKNMKFVESLRTGIKMPVFDSTPKAVRALATKSDTPKEPKAPRAPADPSGRPKAGSATGKVWEIADEVAATITDEKALRKSVIEKCTQAGINSSTASVQFGKWRASR